MVIWFATRRGKCEIQRVQRRSTGHPGRGMDNINKEKRKKRRGRRVKIGDVEGAQEREIPEIPEIPPGRGLRSVDGTIRYYSG